MATHDRNVLLIGGGGYVGSSIAEILDSLGYSVRILDNFIYGHQDLIKPLGIETVYADMNNTKDILDNMSGITDVVVLGGLVGNQVIEKNPNLARKTNYDGVQNIINSLDGLGLNNVIFISTCSNYGIVDSFEYADEGYPLNPLGEYARAKVEAEKLILSKKDKVDYTATVLRFATAFGVSARTRLDLLINEFVYKAVHGQEITVYDENTWRPYCHVKDFGRMIDKVLTAEPRKVYFEVFNCGSNDNNYTKRDVLNAINDQGYYPLVTVDKNNSDPRDYKVFFEKANNVLHFQTKYKLIDGISELIENLKNTTLNQFNTNGRFIF